jgi:hypothetical protein
MLSLAESIEQARERSQLGVALAGSTEVAEYAWHVLEVVALSVAVAKAREDAEHLELALRAHPFVVAVEIVKVGAHRQASLAGSLPVADHIVQFLVLGPLDIGVAIERNEVVGQGTVHRILKVEDSGVGRELRRTVTDDHQVA